MSAHSLVQNELDAFSLWCSENKLTVNASKTKAVLFGTRKIVSKYALAYLMLNNDLVHYVKEYTYLGAHLDNLLIFEAHAKATRRLDSHKIKILSKTQSLTIYKQKILPSLIMLIYCMLEVMRGRFGNSKSNKIEPLEFVYKGTKDVKRIPSILMQK